MPLKEIGPVKAWRNNNRLNPCSANPGLFKKMWERQKEIKSSSEIPSLFGYKPEKKTVPRTRLKNTNS